MGAHVHGIHERRENGNAIALEPMWRLVVVTTVVIQRDKCCTCYAQCDPAQLGPGEGLIRIAHGQGEAEGSLQGCLAQQRVRFAGGDG